MQLIISRSNVFARAALLCAFGSAVLSLPTPSQAASTTLTISGTPATTVAVSGTYSFQPAAKDTVRSRIKFDIYNKPAWATFDGTTGRLSGRPTRRDVGTYRNITIRLTDWYGYVTTAPFAITVVSAPVITTAPTNTASATNNVLLDWTPPTENTDGSVLTNLAGYTVHYGTTPDNLTQTLKVTNPGLTSYVVDDLASGTWYFYVTSFTAEGVESSRSGVISTRVL